jgi:cysteine desulfurase
MIYLDTMASAPLDPRVRGALDEALDCGPGNPHATTHTAGWRAAESFDAARRSVAALIGANASEIVFTSGATEANNLAIRGAAMGRARRRVVVSAIEHPCVLEAARALDHDGFTVSLAPVDGDGRLDIAAFERLVDADTALVSVMLANNEVGTIEPVAEAARIARAAGALVHCDAAQAAGRLPIDVGSLGVDLLSLSAHKVYGPMGIGALFVRNGVSVTPILHGGRQQGGLRAGTVPVALAHGFGVAADLAQSETASDDKRIGALSELFLERLSAGIPGLLLNGPTEKRLSGCLNVAAPGIDARDWLLACPDLAAATGAACASGDGRPSHVLRAMGLPAERIAGSIRLSIGRFTTADEIDRAAVVLRAGAAQASRQGSGPIESAR